MTPCNSYCKLNSNNICESCGRNIQQIKNWRYYSYEEKIKIMDDLKSFAQQNSQQSENNTGNINDC